MARPRKSIAELKQSGSYRPARHKQREDQERAAADAAAAPVPLPPGLDVAAVRAELVALLGGRLTPQDGPLLDELSERLCEVRKLREASRAAKPGTMEYVRISRALTTATTALDRLADRFGLNPAARTSLPAVKPDDGTIHW